MLGEEIDGIGILLEITAGKALVSAVEEDEVVLALDNFENLLPLSLSRVDTSGIVCAHVQEDDLLVSSLIEILEHSIEVKTLSLGIKVAVRFLL